MVRHLDDRLQGGASELHVHVDGPHDVAEANAQATVWFGEAPTSPQACDDAETISPGHCEQQPRDR